MAGCETYLLLGVTVTAHSPQVFESPPQEDYEETPKESDHGGGEESPPHPLAVAVTGHIWWKRDDHIHLGYVDGWIRVEFLPVFRHYRLLVTRQPPNKQPNWDSGASGSSDQRPLTPQRLSHVKSTPPSHLAPLCGEVKVEATADTRTSMKLPL